MIRQIKCRFARLSMFWRYFALLLAALTLFLILLGAVTGRFARVLRSSRLEQIRSSFEKNCELFSRDLFKVYALSAAMEETEDFAQLSFPEVSYDVRSIYRLNKLQDTFSSLCIVQDLSGESFLCFRRNGVCVTRRRVFADAEDMFASYLSYEDPAQQPDLTPGGAPPKMQSLPLARVSVNGHAEDYLTLLIHSGAYDTFYGFLYPLSDVLSTFQLDTLPEGAALTLTRSDGTQLLSYGTAGDAGSYVWLERRVGVLSCQVSLGIPRAYLDTTAYGSRAAAAVMFLLTILLGAALCALIALLCVRPLRLLIRCADTDAPPRGNELAALEGALNAARQQTDSLQNLFLSNLLIRSAAGLSISEEEYQKALAAFPAFRQPMRAAAVYDRAADCEIDDSGSIGRLLRDALPDGFLFHYANLQEAALLLPSTDGARAALESLLRELNGGATFDLRFTCGLSDPFLGLNAAGAAIRQAQSCIPDGEEQMIASPLPDGDDDPVLFDPQRFHRSLTDPDRSDALSRLEELASQAGKGDGVSPEELFYRVLALIRDCARTEKLDLREYESADYQHSRSPASNLRRLKAAVNALFDQRAAAQRTDKQRRCEQIVQYIRDNYSDPTLCLTSLSRQFGVSERFVYSSVSEATGMNVTSFLAQTRMEEAARLLRQTDESVGEIAEQCGYTVESTFYRNFKKYYRVTPAEYKAALRGAER